MAKSKGNDQSNQKLGPVPHHKASDVHSKDAAMLKRDPNRLQKLFDREGSRQFDSKK